MATAGQTTVTGGRTWAISSGRGAMRRVSIPVAFTVNHIGAWGFESVTSNSSSLMAGLYATDGTLLAQSSVRTTPYTTGSAQSATMLFGGPTVYPAGDYDLVVVSSGSIEGNRIEISGQNGTAGTPVDMYDYPDGLYPTLPADYTGLVDTALARAWDMWIDYTESSGGDPAPSIDDVDGDDAITSTQTGWAVNGSDFDDATVEIRQGAVAIGQTVTAQSATEITCSTVFDSGVGPHLKYGSATLAVINGDDQEDTISIGILAPSGRSFVDLTTPNPTADNRITAVADLAAGDQLEIGNVQGGSIADVNVNSDATFDVDESVTAFDVRAWDSSDQTWGAVGTQTVGDIPPPPEPPVFDGTIPNRSFVVSVAIASWNLSTYFTGATSYSSAGTLPTGLTLNSSTGILSGTPTATGTYSGITITGINDDGTDTSNAFTITITDTPPPPGPTKPRRRDGRRRGLLGYIYGRG